MSSLVAAYLFLGGAGAASFLILACVDWTHARFRSGPPSPTNHEKVIQILLKRGYASSLASLLLGVICLMADLGHPEMTLLLFTNPTPSWISAGSFALVVLIGCATFFCAKNTLSLPRSLNRLQPAALGIGGASALFVVAYTGFFLQSMGESIPLWNPLLIVALFALSAISTGIALVLLCLAGLESTEAYRKIAPRLLKADTAILALETCICALHLYAAEQGLGAHAVNMLIWGEWRTVFLGGFVFCGLIAPFAIELAVMRSPHAAYAALPIAALLLIGGFCLRLSFIGAGLHVEI